MTYDEMLLKIHRVLINGSPSAKYTAIKTGLSVSQVRAAQAYLNKHYLEYRWIIAHVSRKRGAEAKYFALPLDKQGKLMATKEGQVLSLLDGHTETLKTHLTQNKNQAASFRAMADNCYGDPTLKHMLRDNALDAEQRVVKQEHLLNYIEEVKAAC